MNEKSAEFNVSRQLNVAHLKLHPLEMYRFLRIPKILEVPVIVACSQCVEFYSDEVATHSSEFFHGTAFLLAVVKNSSSSCLNFSTFASFFLSSSLILKGIEHS